MGECHTSYRRVEEVRYEEKCAHDYKTVCQQHYKTVYEKKCHYVEKCTGGIDYHTGYPKCHKEQVCQDVPRQVPDKKCHQVPHKVCHKVPKKPYKKVPHQQCKHVPYQQCHNVAVKVPIHVPVQHQVQKCYQPKNTAAAAGRSRGGILGFLGSLFGR